MSNQRSALHKPRLRIAAATLAVAACGTASADKSQAITGACLEDSTTVRACSDKELSNVVVQCGDESSTYFVKYDELGDGTFPGLTTPRPGTLSSCLAVASIRSPPRTPPSVLPTLRCVGPTSDGSSACSARTGRA